jgi:hypothetical protein
LRTSSSLFACISCTSLWYWAKAPSSLDWSMAECFLAFASSFSSDYARNTASPYPWSISNFCQDLSTTSCKRQHLLLGYSALAADRLSKGTDTYLHPLLGPTHRLQVACHYRRVNKIIRQKLESTTTSRGGLGHRRRTDRLRILDFW